MKKIFALVCVFAMLAALVSCGGGDSGEAGTTAAVSGTDADTTSADTAGDTTVDTEADTTAAADTTGGEDDVIIIGDNSGDLVGKWEMAMSFEDIAGASMEGFSTDAAIVFSVEFKDDGTAVLSANAEDIAASYAEYWSDCENFLKADDYAALLSGVGVDSIEEIENVLDMTVDEYLGMMEEVVVGSADTLLEEADEDGNIVSNEEFVLIGNQFYMDDDLDTDDLDSEICYILDMEGDDTYIGYSEADGEEYMAFTMKKIG